MFFSDWKQWGFGVAVWNWRFQRFAKKASKAGFKSVRTSR